MARVALKNAEHEEIIELSRIIISTQQAEIEQLESIKSEEFGTSQVPREMSQQQMQMMGMTDPKELAENIVSAQQKEIEQMKQWREDWYPEG
jgi:uncharacterized protein (DUF305 family)